MTLTERLSLTYWHAAQHVARGGRPDHALAAARVAEGTDRDEQLQHVHLQPLRRDRAADAEGQAVEQPRPVAADGRGLTMRIDPIAEPRDVDRAARSRRQCIPVLYEPAAPLHVDDSPTVARVVGVEAYRRHVDSVALDPAHGTAQNAAIGAARDREIDRLAKLLTDAAKDTTDARGQAAWLIARGVRL
jgi:hypothetical protein